MDRAEGSEAIDEQKTKHGFATGTVVRTKEGLVPIEQIKVGDWVLSYPDDQPISKEYKVDFNPPQIYKRALQVFVTEKQAVTEFPILNTGTGDIERLTATLNHPIFVLNHGWMTLAAIRARRQLVGVENYRFKNLMLGGLYKDKGLTTVYTIEVEDFHTYYVGNEGMWVHNFNCGGWASQTEDATNKTNQQSRTPSHGPC